MKVLVIGGGGREHALVWKIRQSARVKQIYCVPGNAGIADEAGVECIAWDSKGDDLDSLLGIASKLQPDLTVVGPELPLSLGIVDELTKRGLRVFGPTKAAAQLEASKGFAKEFMRRHNIPTAKYALCHNDRELDDALKLFTGKVVVKADGLAAGKGVVVAADHAEATAAAKEMLSGRSVGGAGARVVLEECLEGEEISFLVLSDGEHVAPLVPAQDHKRAFDGDTGPNTGGMGAYSTPKLLDPHMQEWVLTHIVRPVIAGMKAEDAEYRGILYCGLMMTARGPQVLEFNCRFGDPETQAVLMRLNSDLVDAFEAAINGRVSDGDFKWSDDCSACVVLASGGYPGKFETGKVIRGLAEAAAAVETVKIFHAGTARSGNDFVTSGGRVLGVSARGESLAIALERAYRAAEKVSFEGMHYRRDIGAKALKSGFGK